MALTIDEVKQLSKPFPMDAHEWRKGRNNRDYVYITESAVVARLNEVDPSWSLVVTDRAEREYSTTRKNTTTGEMYTLSAHELAITVSLTIKGVARYGIGMAEIAPDAAEADKSAVTDALKRAARLFGVGAYLLNDPPAKAQFPAWLATLANGGVHTPSNASAAPAPSGAAGNGNAAHGWTKQLADDLSAYAAELGLSSAQVLRVLAVDRLSQFKAGPDMARQMLKAHADKQAQGAQS